MQSDGMTTEFSINLLPDPAVAESVQALRQLLPPSPYRDDTPHMTLIRSIKSRELVTDNALLQDIAALLHPGQVLPLESSVARPINGFSPIYKLSSGILLHALGDMVAYRKSAMTRLQDAGYSIGAAGKAVFPPHISVRLGVPFTEPVRAEASRLFPKDQVISFSRWAVYRVMYQDGQRLLKELEYAA